MNAPDPSHVPGAAAISGSVSDAVEIGPVARAAAAPRPRTWSGWWLRRLLSVFILYIAWIVFLTFFQTRMIYPGAYEKPGAAANPPFGVESIWVETEPGVRVEAWFVPGEGRSAAKPGPAVLIGHGNFEWIHEGVYHAEEYRKLGVSVLLAEYRGYGRSGGEPSEAGITRDFLAMYDWLAARPEVDRARIVGYGRSLGGAAIAQVSAVRPFAAVILESAFSSMDSMAARYLAPSFMVRDHWRTDRVLPTLKVPILLMHGRSDPVISVSHSRRLREIVTKAGGDVRLEEYDGAHTDFPAVNEDRYWQIVREFLVHAKIPLLDRP
ncbi:MAG: hypothetical protein AMXMBFR47_04860 [Planctomycetota bacterium]